MKYKIAAIADVIFGLTSIIWGVFYYTSIYSKLAQVYNDFGAAFSPVTGYLTLIISCVLGLVLFFCAYKVKASITKNKDFYLALGVVLIVITVLVIPAIVAQATLLPMFNLVNTIK